MKTPSIIHSAILIGACICPVGWIPSASAQSVGSPSDQIILQREIGPEDVKDAGAQAVEAAVAEFMNRNARGPLQRFVLLPLEDDPANGYFNARIQNEFAARGSQSGIQFFTREDSEVARLLDEIGWGQDFAGEMDAATIQKFGNIKGAQAVLRPSVTVSATRDVTTVRAIITGNEVETFRMIPGADAKREILGPPSALARWTGVIIVILGVIALVIVLGIVWAMVRKAAPR